MLPLAETLSLKFLQSDTDMEVVWVKPQHSSQKTQVYVPCDSVLPFIGTKVE